MSPVENKAPSSKITFVQNQGADFRDKLVSVMAHQADVFEQKAGRKMTYSEMRSMFG